MSGDLAIRPLSLGDVVDRAVAVTRASFPALFAVCLATGLPALVLYRAYAGVLSELLEVTLSRHALPPAGAERLFAWSAAVLGLSSLLQLVASGAIAAVVAPRLLGEDGEAGLRPGLERALSRRLAVGSAAAAVFGALFLAAGAGALPGALAAWATEGLTRSLALALSAAGGLAALLWAVVRLALAPSAAGAEGLHGLRSLRRSARLMGAAPGERIAERPGIRVSAIFFVTLLLALAVNGLTGLPRAALTLALGRGGPLSPLPLPAELGVGLLEAVGNAAVQPFGLVALTVFYFDRRARREGLDLERWAEALAGPEAS
ncbi:MAG TPA: hypothetical protein VMK42_01535 [Anaeromyxobacteraceae bacterium]|nr:hypothetical protein [Anaeromyxobacteraceae bacterium]